MPRHAVQPLTLITPAGPAAPLPAPAPPPVPAWQTGPAAAPGRCLATASSRIEDKLFRFAFSVSALKLYRLAGMQM